MTRYRLRPSGDQTEQYILHHIIPFHFGIGDKHTIHHFRKYQAGGTGGGQEIVILFASK